MRGAYKLHTIALSSTCFSSDTLRPAGPMIAQSKTHVNNQDWGLTLTIDYLIARITVNLKNRTNMRRNENSV